MEITGIERTIQPKNGTPYLVYDLWETGYLFMVGVKIDFLEWYQEHFNIKIEFKG